MITFFLIRWGQILWARVRCHYYLLSQGMWRGEAEALGWDDDGFIVIIAAARGSVKNMTMEYTRVFFDEMTRPETHPIKLPWSVEPPPVAA
jgi:hypothetical protein